MNPRWLVSFGFLLSSQICQVCVHAPAGSNGSSDGARGVPPSSESDSGVSSRLHSFGSFVCAIGATFPFPEERYEYIRQDLFRSRGRRDP